MKESNQSILWFLFPKIAATEAYISPFLRQKFIEMHRENKFDELVRNTILPICKELSTGLQNRSNNIGYGSQNRIFNFDRDMAIMRSKQRRFRF
jgi:hypothetical protein